MLFAELALDPLGRCLPDLRRLLHQLHPARELPRHRRGLHRLSERSLLVPPGAGLVRPVRRCGLHAPGHQGFRSGARARDRVRTAGAPDVARAARVVPGSGVGHGLYRARGRRALRAVRTPRGIPARHRRQPARHRRVLGPVVPERGTARVGCRARHLLPRARADDGVRGWTGRGGRRRHRAGPRLARIDRRVVAVLPGLRVRGARRAHPHPGQLAATSIDAGTRGGRCGLLLETVLPPRAATGFGADRRSRQRQRCRARVGSWRRPRGRRGDRSSLAAGRQRAASGASLPGPPRQSAHRRRACVPGAQRRAVRPHPVRPSRLADPRERPGIAAARELPVHHRSDGLGAGAPGPGRRLRDVQLLPRRRVRTLRGHHA